LRRLVREYVAYFRQDRIHDALGKDTPHRRPVEKKPCPEATGFPARGWAVCIIATLGVKRPKRSQGVSLSGTVSKNPWNQCTPGNRSVPRAHRPSGPSHRRLQNPHGTRRSPHPNHS
jgi:hypothetical protein